MIGQSLAHFEITAKLGEGGMGEVYRATDTKLERDVAVKVLPPDFVADEERLARFEREAKVLASLNHPSIAGIFEVGKADGVHFLAMELAEGNTLAERLSEGPMPIDETLVVALRLAEGLEAAHERGIVHRDLKPANIVLSGRGPETAVKILDFGLARAFEDGSHSDIAASVSPTITARMTGAGVILGTAAYMSPEQARGHSVGPRSDVWSFGVILWELLAGERLFEEDTVSDTLAAVLKTDIDVESVRGSTPPHVRHLVSRCLARDPRRRLQAIGEARIALENAVGSPPHDSTPDAGAARHPRTLRSLAGPLAATALATAALATALTLALRPAPPPLPLRKAVLSIEEGMPRSPFTQVAFSPDGSRFIYPTNEGLKVRDLADTTSTGVEGADADYTHAGFWSSDGRHIAYSSKSELMRTDLEGGGTWPIGDIPAGGVALDGFWHSDGTIVFTTWRGGVFEIPAAGGAAEEIVPLAEGDVDVHELIPLPGERGFLMGIHAQANRWRTDAFRDGQRSVVMEEGYAVGLSPSGHLLFTGVGPREGLWAVSFDSRSLEPMGEPFLVHPTAGMAAVSSDGSLVYAPQYGQTDNSIVWVDRSGEVLETLGVSLTEPQAPTLSPDGTRIAAGYIAEGGRTIDIFVLDTTRSVWTRLTAGADESKGTPAWSADGSRIYYQHGNEIRVIRADGIDGPTTVLEGRHPSPSRDGRWLLFNRGRECFRVPLGEDGLAAAEPVHSVDPSEGRCAAVVSPDGRYLAYHASIDGSSQVYLTEFPDARSRLQVSSEYGALPQWRADGAALFFLVGPEIREVQVDLSGEIPKLGRETVLFDATRKMGRSVYNGYAVSADGERFLLTMGGSVSSAPQLVVVQNWIAEFER